MMKNSFIKMMSIMIIILISNINIIYGNKKVNFDKIEPKEGLSQGIVTCMMQDGNGVMWIGTIDGLNRYNGYDMKVYKDDKGNENDIAGNYIVDIKEDYYGNIWVATNYGINKISYNDNSIKSYTNIIDSESLKEENSSEILITKDKHIILATTEGISIYNEKKDMFEKIEMQEFKSNYIYAIEEDDEGYIWISTKDGLFKISKEFKVIKVFYRKDLDIKSDIIKIYYDKNGYIWLGTIRSGMIKIDLKDNTIKKFIKDTSEENTLQSNSIRDILRDKNDNLWICTDNGISKYNEKEDEFETYKSKGYDSYSLLDDNTICILEDNSGHIYIGTYSGVSVFNSTNDIEIYYSNIYDDNTINGNSVKSIYEDNEGLVWISTDKDGINIINRDKNKVKYITKDKDSFLLNNNVNYIMGSGDKIYLGTVNGLVVIDKKLETTNIYTKDDGLQSNYITIMLLDSKGYLWIGTIEGVSILDTRSNTILDIEKESSKKKLENKIVGSLFEDSEGNYYVGYIGNGGLIKINASEDTYKIYKYDKENQNSITSNTILSIAEDKDKNIWVGTRMGLNKIDKNSEKITRYTMNDGIPNDSIYAILVDKENNIWISTNNGISSIDYKNNEVRNITILDGLQGMEFNQNSYYKSEKGEFFFGGIHGLNIFKPEDIRFDKVNQNLVIDSFLVNDNEYKTIDNMIFNYDQNYIEINFFVPSYKNANKTKYFYKLEGPNHNGQWNSTEETKLIYSDLIPGNYIFKLKSKGFDGVFSEEINVNFTIKQPIYASNIAIIGYILIIMGLIYRHKNKVENLDKAVFRKTKQLEDEISNNEELLNKIIDLEKSKSRYFVNLSHELRTPLNVINGTTQLVDGSNKNNKELSMEKVEYHMNVINKNCNQLLGLIDNIIDTTKLDHDTYTINFKSNEIVSLVEDASIALKDYIESKDITFIIDTDIEEKYINCDKSEIERCIINLIGNARKFTPSGGCINVDIKDLGDKVEISVIDSGIGIEEKYLENIFDRFSQVLDMKKEAVKGGSGLGLTITKQIIIKHNGTIHAESELGKGSKFIIRLPIN